MLPIKKHLSLLFALVVCINAAMQSCNVETGPSINLNMSGWLDSIGMDAAAKGCAIGDTRVSLGCMLNLINQHLKQIYSAKDSGKSGNSSQAFNAQKIYQDITHKLQEWYPTFIKDQDSLFTNSIFFSRDRYIYWGYVIRVGKMEDIGTIVPNSPELFNLLKDPSKFTEEKTSKYSDPLDLYIPKDQYYFIYPSIFRLAIEAGLDRATYNQMLSLLIKFPKTKEHSELTPILEKMASAILALEGTALDLSKIGWYYFYDSPTLNECLESYHPEFLVDNFQDSALHDWLVRQELGLPNINHILVTSFYSKSSKYDLIERMLNIPRCRRIHDTTHSKQILFFLEKLLTLRDTQSDQFSKYPFGVDYDHFNHTRESINDFDWQNVKMKILESDTFKGITFRDANGAEIIGNENEKLLIYAIISKRDGLLKYLLQRGDASNFTVPEILFAAHGKRIYSNYTPLLVAVLTNNAIGAQILLDYKANFQVKNKNGKSPLILYLNLPSRNWIEPMLALLVHNTRDVQILQEALALVEIYLAKYPPINAKEVQGQADNRAEKIKQLPVLLEIPNAVKDLINQKIIDVSN